MRKYLSNRYTSLLILLLTVFLYQCGTEKNTTINRFYHNLTSYYNILFNGKESYEKGLERYSEAYQYDFTRLLPLFIYGNKDLSENIKPQMDRTIEKCSKLIRLHSITSKPEDLKDKRDLTKEEQQYYNKSEFNKYVDDAYLLMGKAYFWEMQYETASKVLEYASREFSNDFINNQAEIWLSRCYIELGQFRESTKVLKGLEQNKELAKELKDDFFATYTDHFIKQDQYQKSIPYLKRAIRNTDEKQKKVRYTFILAQIYEETENYDPAFTNYDRVIDLNPNYDMEFNAKLKRAWLYKRTNRSGASIKRELEKMLGEAKNEDYKDQIYFALGKIAEEENNPTKAVEYYKKSAQFNVNNTNQKGLAYRSMADILFQKKQYTQAQAYYDSAVTSLESTYPGYTDLFIKTQHLTKLVENLNTIERQDSLLKVANMEPAERERLITQLIEKQREEERQKRLAEQNQRNFQAQRAASNNNQQRNSGGKWYFYSSTAVQRGKSEFKRRWGDRKLSDNWRVNSKTQGNFGGFAEQNKQEQQGTPEQYSRTNRNFYMKNLPMSDSAKRSAHKKIQEAYFNLGKVYMNNLNNPPKAIDAFKNLISKYPDNPFKLSAYYYLYKMYNEQGNASEANTYKNRIISEFPESNHAKVLTNPDYFKELENKKNQAEKLYSETLESYQNKEFQKVLANCSKAKEEIKDSTYLSRFEYLRAISIGQTRDIISFRQSLQSVAENYPDSEVAGQAQDILAYLKKTELQQISKKFAQNRSLLNDQDTTSGEEASKTATRDQQQEEDSLYQFNKEEPYYFVVIANPEKIDIGRLKFDLINFNLDYFLQKDYATSSEEFNEYYNIVTVKRFKNRDVAEKYYDILSKKEDRVFSEINSDEYRYFYISVKNYLTLLDKKSIIEYINFFKKNELLAADNSQQ